MTEHIPFPMFELGGTPCKASGCNGVLINTISMKTGQFYKKCSVCGSKFEEQSTQTMLDAAVETIEKVLK